MNNALTDIGKESEPAVNITQNAPPPIPAPRLEKRAKLPKLDFSKIRKNRFSASQFSIFAKRHGFRLASTMVHSF